jgi:hypothetical protein
MLAGLKAQYEADGTFPTKYDLTARFKGRGGDVVPATTVQTLADRLSKALIPSAEGPGHRLRLPTLQDAQPLALYSASPVCHESGCLAG